jgi:hypothetical protein
MQTKNEIVQNLSNIFSINIFILWLKDSLQIWNYVLSLQKHALVDSPHRKQ